MRTKKVSVSCHCTYLDSVFLPPILSMAACRPSPLQQRPELSGSLYKLSMVISVLWNRAEAQGKPGHVSEKDFI